MTKRNLFFGVAFFIAALQFSFAQTKSNEKLLYSFVATGCNRVDKEDVNPENPSTANVEQLSIPLEVPEQTIHPIETPPAPPSDRPKSGPVPLNGSGVTNGYSGLFDNISWGSR